MIVRKEHGRLRLTLQTDHAFLTGQFAHAWGGERFGPLEPLAAVKLAAEIHDQGWQAWEQQPRVERPSGRPYDFLNIPSDQHVPMCESAIQAALDAHPYAGLLVSLHGTGFYRQRYGHMPHLTYKDVEPAYQAIVDRFLAAQKVLQDELLADLNPDPEVLWTHYRWLQAWDLLSLWLCMADPAEGQTMSLGVMPLFPGGPEDEITVRGAGPGKYVVTPWPFVRRKIDAIIPVRHIPDRCYQSDEEYLEAFEAAPTESLAVCLVPGV